MPESSPLLNASAIARALTRIAHEIAERNESGSDIVCLGIQTGGAHLARRLAAILADIWRQPVACGTLDVSMHRDDLGQKLAPEVHPTEIPGDITGKTVILVDDVLFSGRTIRAALDALHDFGRPRRVQLAVLIDRGHRELPIKSDFVGKTITTRLDERVNVQISETAGSDSITLERA